jgi:hypothetical protein
MDEQVIERIRQQPPGMQRVVAFLDELGNRIRSDVQQATQAGSKEEAIKIFEETAEQYRIKRQMIAEALAEQPGQSQGQQTQTQ